MRCDFIDLTLRRTPTPARSRAAFARAWGPATMALATLAATSLGGLGVGCGGGGESLPAAPTGLAVGSVTRSSVMLTWVDNASDETGFVVQRRQWMDPFATVGNVAAGSTSYQDSSALPYVTYTYRVAAVGNGGSSGWSDEVSATTLPAMSYDLTIAEGTFWDFEWWTRTTSYGQGAAAATGIYRVWLGAPTLVAGRTAFPVHYAGPLTEFVRRLAYVSYDAGVVYGSADGATWTTLLDSRTSFAIGGGFLRELASGVLYKAQEGRFSNDLMSGQGVVIERSVSTSDRVCVPGYGCVSGSEGDTNFTQQEFWMPGVGPAGYYELFSLNQGYQNQQTIVKQIGLLASSTRGDAGYFLMEAEPNDRVSTASQAPTLTSGVLGSFAAGDGGFVLTASYYNPFGILMGTVTDALQDCYRASVPTTSHATFHLSWDPSVCPTCRYSIVSFVAGEGYPVFSTSLLNNNFSLGQLWLSVQDVEISHYGSSYVMCVGTNASARIPYTLQRE